MLEYFRQLEAEERKKTYLKWAGALAGSILVLGLGLVIATSLETDEFEFETDEDNINEAEETPEEE